MSAGFAAAGRGKTLASETSVRMVGTLLPLCVRCPFAAFFN
jgi:hypothetical protein